MSKVTEYCQNKWERVWAVKTLGVSANKSVGGPEPSVFGPEPIFQTTAKALGLHFCPLIMGLFNLKPWRSARLDSTLLAFEKHVATFN